MQDGDDSWFEESVWDVRCRVVNVIQRLSVEPTLGRPIRRAQLVEVIALLRPESDPASLERAAAQLRTIAECSSMTSAERLELIGQASRIEYLF